MRAVIAISFLVSATTYADVYMRVQPHPGGAPTLETTLVDEARVPATAIWATSPTGEFAPVAATGIRDFAAGNEPIAIELVVQGSEVFAGNDQLETTSADVYYGMLVPLEAGLAALDLAHLGPPGSQIGVVTFANGASLRVPMQPLATFSPAQLGGQKDYRASIGDDLVQGVTLGLAELEHAHAAVKLLVIVGDGNDTNNEMAKPQLADLRKTTRMDGIQVDAMIWKTALSADGAVVASLAPRARTLSDTSDVGLALREVFAHATSRYYVTFPGDALPWDGRSHDIVVRLGHTDLDSLAIALVPKRAAPRAWWSPRWVQIVGGAVLVGLLLLGLRLKTRGDTA